jgi:hypothetical protein
VVTAASRTDLALCVLLNQDEEIGYGFDEPDDLTHAHAVTINRSQGGEYSAWSSPGDQRVVDLAAHPGPLSLSPRTSAFTAHVLVPLGTRSLRPHYFTLYGRQRPAETPVRTAVSPRLLIRMRPLVQVQPGPQIDP